MTTGTQADGIARPLAQLTLIAAWFAAYVTERRAQREPRHG